jgi:hypothetical protein
MPFIAGSLVYHLRDAPYREIAYNHQNILTFLIQTDQHHRYGFRQLQRIGFQPGSRATPRDWFPSGGHFNAYN